MKLTAIKISAAWVLLFISQMVIASVDTPKCLYVSSYHEDYAWDQGIRNGLAKSIGDACEMSYFYMDTKRNKEANHGHLMANKAMAKIRAYEPDVIIAADDNASKYLVKPYLKDASIPVVFCGINHSVEPYGYPYRNATGMVEIPPHRPILSAMKEIRPEAKHGVYVTADVYSQRKSFKALKAYFAERDIELTARFVSSMDEWQEAWLEAIQTDFVFVGNPAGISDWNAKKNLVLIHDNPAPYSFTMWEWLSPHAMLTITKKPEEQGEWAGQVTKQILTGVRPYDIPVVSNRQWDLSVNKKLISTANIKLPWWLHSRAGN